MLCKVADLIVDLDESCNLAELASAYRIDEDVDPQIVIRANDYDLTKWMRFPEASVHYVESGAQFYRKLLRFDGMMLHASAVEYGGKAYLFSGPCGTGKSTHTSIWVSTFGDKVKLFNDDKPALRRYEGRWYAYGTPWCGKNHVNINMRVPLAGICFLKQAPENKIRRLDGKEAVSRIISQTMKKGFALEQMSLLLTHVDKLIREIPIFELENRPEPAAAQLSYETMRKAAEEAGL